ncbi:MAG: RrF2 family transcriptional regulator [Pikeienuella sp.]
MQLSKFSDYALRTLMHLAVAEDNVLTTRQIAAIHDAKYNHLTKVTQWLAREGYVTSIRGRTGGIRLARPMEDISVGDVVRRLESQTELVECMRADGGACILSPCCGLTGALAKAQSAFFEVLDGYTLADISGGDSRMRKLLASLNAA